VAVYFFDSSALVKRYAQETGSAWVEVLTDPQAGHRLYLARITVVEVVAAVARRQRGGALSTADAAAAIAPASRPTTPYDHVLSPEARCYCMSRPSFLRRYLPFWGATSIARLLVMGLPLVGLTDPVCAVFAPGVSVVRAGTHLPHCYPTAGRSRRVGQQRMLRDVLNWPRRCGSCVGASSRNQPIYLRRKSRPLQSWKEKMRGLSTVFEALSGSW
jgi:hypothetical protein